MSESAGLVRTVGEGSDTNCLFGVMAYSDQASGRPLIMQMEITHLGF